MSNCGHSWEPVFGWNGRYRCKWCGALGYRQIINGGARGVPWHIVIYVCRHEGCKEPAVVGPKKGQLCVTHVKPENCPADLKLNISS
jgi:hypothetical protein